MQLVNIRGTTSSGKTTLVRQLIGSSRQNKMISLTPKAKGHVLDDKVIIGSYKEGSKFGGVDGISKIEYAEQAIMKALCMKPMVVFEGLLVSHSYERWKNNSEEFRKLQKKHKVKVRGIIWIFTLPTFRENLDRLKKRNEIVGSLREVRGDHFIKNFIQRYKSIHRIKKKAINDGEIIYILKNSDPFKHLQSILDSIKEDKLLPLEKTGMRKFL